MAKSNLRLTFTLLKCRNKRRFGRGGIDARRRDVYWTAYAMIAASNMQNAIFLTETCQISEVFPSRNAFHFVKEGFCSVACDEIVPAVRCVIVMRICGCNLENFRQKRSRRSIDGRSDDAEHFRGFPDWVIRNW